MDGGLGLSYTTSSLSEPGPVDFTGQVKFSMAWSIGCNVGNEPGVAEGGHFKKGSGDSFRLSDLCLEGSGGQEEECLKGFK